VPARPGGAGNERCWTGPTVVSQLASSTAVKTRLPGPEERKFLRRQQLDAVWISGAWYKPSRGEDASHEALHSNAQQIQNPLLFVVRSGLKHNFRIVEGDRLLANGLEPFQHTGKAPTPVLALTIRVK